MGWGLVIGFTDLVEHALDAHLEPREQDDVGDDVLRVDEQQVGDGGAYHPARIEVEPRHGVVSADSPTGGAVTSSSAGLLLAAGAVSSAADQLTGHAGAAASAGGERRDRPMRDAAPP